MQPTKPAQTEREYLDQLLNEIEAAKALGFSVRALQNWRVRGGGPVFVKISRRSVRYRRRDLLTWIEAHCCANTAQASPTRL
jgi:predicted DNA-binding transcriptional regulator AlpA